MMSIYSASINFSILKFPCFHGVQPVVSAPLSSLWLLGFGQRPRLDTGGNVLMLTVWRGSKHVNGTVHGRWVKRGMMGGGTRESLR